ncbi:MAG: AMP-binding protein [Rhodospirillales bacterium]
MPNNQSDAMNAPQHAGAVRYADTMTLPKLMLYNARSIPKAPAIREKTLGIWQTFGWAAYAEHVRDFALGLAALGFARGEKVTVVGDNRPRLYWAQVAAQSLGGMAVPVYQDSIASELVYVLNHAEVSVIVAEDQEQVDKILSLKEQLPTLRHIVYDDPRGMTSYSDDFLLSFEEVEKRGREFSRQHPGYFEQEVEKGKPEDIALLAYTSGTTGNPKGAILTHRNLISASESFLEVENIKRGDDWLSYLPMAWVGDSIFSLVLSMIVGVTCSCPESPETVQRDLRELGPTGIIAPPRIWENMLTGLQVKAADASPLKRHVFNYFRSLAEAIELGRSEGKQASAGQRLMYRIGEFLVYGPVRDQLGLRRMRWAYTGGAPLGADAFRFFRGFGVNLKQVYGSTECSALVAYQPDSEADPNTVGRPCPRIDIKVDERGEVLVKGGGVFNGYFKQDEATRGAIDGEGWFHTGDAGFFDPQGHLVIIDRAKDVGKLDDGTPFAPQFIENKLKFSPFIREAVSFGNAKPFVTTMIAIDLNTVGNWAERNSLPYTSFMDLAQKDEVRTLIAGEIAKCNATLPEATRIRRFLLLVKDLEADDAEITRTRKLRRGFIAEKYAPVIEAFYSGHDRVDLSTEITYEDGRKAKIDSTVTIQNVADSGVTQARAA